MKRAGGRASMSFGPAELDWLSDVLRAVEERKPLSAFAQRPEAGRMSRKVRTLKGAATRAQEKRALRPLPAHSNRKLWPEAVRAIRRLGAQGESRRAIAAMFGVDRRTIRKVIAREAWAHVE